MLSYEYYSDIEICDEITPEVAKGLKGDEQQATSPLDVKALL